VLASLFRRLVVHADWSGGRLEPGVLARGALIDPRDVACFLLGGACNKQVRLLCCECKDVLSAGCIPYEDVICAHAHSVVLHRSSRDTCRPVVIRMVQYTPLDCRHVNMYEFGRQN
jgi:hypothetical protein